MSFDASIHATLTRRLTRIKIKSIDGIKTSFSLTILIILLYMLRASKNIEVAKNLVP